MTTAPPSTAAGALSAAEVAAWARDGFLVRRQVFSPAEVTGWRSAVEVAAATAATTPGRDYHLDGHRFRDLPDHTTVQFEHTPGSTTVRVVEPVHHLHMALEALVDDPRITAPMQGLVGSATLALWTDKLNLKRAGEGSGFRWHQDSPYWMHDSPHLDQLVNVMVLLDDADAANGCFRVVRGSHRAGMLPGTDDGSQLGGFFTDPGSFDARDAVDMAAPAGSLVFFSAHSVHGSEANRSVRSRRALVLTYQPAGWPMLKTGRERPVPAECGGTAGVRPAAGVPALPAGRGRPAVR